MRFLTLLMLMLPGLARGQTFVVVTDAANPIANGVAPGGYSGAAWVDADGDGDLDLFLNNNHLFRNDGGGQFSEVATALGEGQLHATGNGQTWADYDNDGDLDAYICTGTSFLYRNDGNLVFTKITDGAIGDGFANRGWSCAWADYDNDGYVDLFITHPAGFIPPANDPTPNHLLHNDGPPDFTFTPVTTGPVVADLAAFTVGTWSDFDLDGDVDLFIGAGPANGTTARDYLFQNLLAETGTATFERINEGLPATELQDGQVWNWIDYDNDGDLDGFLTNWGGTMGGLNNRLYRNDDGVFTKIVDGPLVTDRHISLSAVWEDFDNDGDLDCFVANDNNQPDRYYRNEGDGTFTAVTNAATTSRTSRGAAAGDYDNDGDLDLIVLGSTRSLFRNDLSSGNHWLKLRLRGTTANAAAIGARVRAKARIGGVPVWQMREVQSQNTFNGLNSLVVHVGLGDAAVVDSLEVTWPGGRHEVRTGVAADQTLDLTEGLVEVASEASLTLPAGLMLDQNHPNPFMGHTTIRYALPAAGPVSLRVYDLLGREVAVLLDGRRPAGAGAVSFPARDLPGGTYLYRLRAGGAVVTRLLTLLH